MTNLELSDRKPGLGTAFYALLIFLLAAVVIVVWLFVYRKTNTYDVDRSAKRFETLKLLNEENAKKSAEYAVLDKEKGIFQIPIKDAMALTVKDLSQIKPHAAYPVPTPIPAVPVPPAETKVDSSTSEASTPTTPATTPATPSTTPAVETSPAIEPVPTVAPTPGATTAPIATPSTPAVTP